MALGWPERRWCSALAGSQLLFLFSRRLAKDRVRRKLGKRLDLFERQFAKHGLFYVIGLRIVGAPHFLVTAGSALMPMNSWTFGLATFIGMLPVIALAAVAGHPQ
ncbi:TVP38/TMEM64 family protein [Sphingobium sp.]|uniref:TVP38/TMEM64 family protein n=1 Tax=Sphingobium sp. TaxID=1912891 RepID=UPI0039B9C8A5